MKSIKAIAVGLVFVIVVMLFIQLGYLFIAVGYNSLQADYPLLKDIPDIVRHLMMIPLFIAVLFVAGYIVAAIAEQTTRTSIVIHALVVGVVSVGGMMYSATSYMSLTGTGVFIFVLAQCGVVAGGLFWLRSVKRQSIEPV